MLQQRRKFVLATAAVFLAPAFAFAKCTIPIVSVTGRVVDRQGRGIHGAIVGAAWTRDQLPQGPVHALTEADGSFQLRFQFNTFTKSSLFRGDVCNERLDVVSVSASAQGLRSEYVQVPLKDWQADINIVVDPYRE